MYISIDYLLHRFHEKGGKANWSKGLADYNNIVLFTSLRYEDNFGICPLFCYVSDRRRHSL